MNGPITGADLSGVAVAIPAAGLAGLILLFALRGILRALRAPFPATLRERTAKRFAPLLRLFPPRGRTTRTIAWVSLFAALFALLMIPIAIDPFGLRAQSRLWTLDQGRWLAAMAIAVSALCAAVAAWGAATRSAAWAGLLGLEMCTLAVVTTTSLGVTLLALDGAMLMAAVLLVFWSPPDSSLSCGLRRAVRGHLFITLAASFACWLGLYLSNLHFSTGPFFLALGLLLRCAIVPLHAGFVDLHGRIAGPAAMLVAGALLPASLVAAIQFCPELPRTICLILTITGLLGFVASLRETDLRRVVGRWASAGSTVAASIILSLPLASRATGRGLQPDLIVVGLAAASTMATFLAALIEQDAGHREISRLRGLAARSPGAFGWMVLAALLLTGAPPGANFAGAMLLPGGYPLPAALLFAIATPCCLTQIHRTFLGLPRSKTATETPIDLTPRERLVLVLLLTISLAATAAPTTWLR